MLRFSARRLLGLTHPPFPQALTARATLILRRLVAHHPQLRLVAARYVVAIHCYLREGLERVSYAPPTAHPQLFLTPPYPFALPRSTTALSLAHV